MRSDPAKSTSSSNPIFSTFADEPEMRDLVEMFVQELPARVGAMQQAFNQNELDQLKRTAHQLKGAGGGYGFGCISDAAGQLEHLLLSVVSAESPTPETLAGVRDQLEDLTSLCSRVRA